MSLTSSMENVSSIFSDAVLNHYRLDIPSCSSTLDVESFNGFEGLSSLYRYNITFTSTDMDIAAKRILKKSATMIMGGRVLQSLTEQKRIHGVVTDFQRISGSNDQVTYHITLEPFMSLLRNQFRTHRFFVNKSVPEVVAEVLLEHGLIGWEYEFTLKADYPKG